MAFDQKPPLQREQVAGSSHFQQENKGHYTEKMHSLVYIHDGKTIAPYSRIIIRKKKDYTPEHERFHT